MKNPVFRSYRRPNGHNEFVNSLPIKDQRKLYDVIQVVEEHGLLAASRMQLTKKILDNLFELRSQVGNNIQRVFYFHVQDNDFVFTHGFTENVLAESP